MSLLLLQDLGLEEVKWYLLISVHWLFLFWAASHKKRGYYFDHEQLPQTDFFFFFLYPM